MELAELWLKNIILEQIKEKGMQFGNKKDNYKL